MNKLFKTTQAWVEKNYFNAEHLVRTVYWVKKLKPSADKALLLAALTHDIERAFEKGREPPSSETDNWDNQEYNRWHSRRSAEFASEFLKNAGADNNLIKRVSALVGQHEEGGSEETDILKDADSISFLEVNAPWFIAKIPEKWTKESVKEKIDYMFRRINGEKAKTKAKPFYQKALFELEKAK